MDSLTSSARSSVRDSSLNFGTALLGTNGVPSEPFDVTLRNVSRKVNTTKDGFMLLDDVSLYFRPGTMTLILGAPGCGKTTLFKVLANQGANKKKTQTGQVLFNGRPAGKTHHQSVAYITQEDTHFTSLTVRETLKFSLDCQAPKHMPIKVRNRRVELLLDLLDLKHVEDVIVGDELTRGISGGQRKRVTIGVSLTRNPALLLMDEATTGLDSNTALEVITSIRSVCNKLHTPVVAALLQPSPEICALFDNLVILTKGRVGYFGSFKNAVPYFARYGLEGDKFQNDPEFLQEAVEYAHKYSDKTTDQMVELYRNSPEYEEAMREIGPEETILDGAELPIEFKEKTYPTSFARQIQLNMAREWTMMKRDLASLRSRFFKKLIVGILIGSLFLQLTNEQKDIRKRFGVMFFAVLFIPFSNVGNIAPFYRDRAVFYLQRDQKYYSPLAYVMSKTLFELPLIIIESIMFCASLYWMIGLRPEAERFICFMLIVMASNLFSVVYCKLAATVLAIQQVAAAIVPFTFGVYVLFTGFIVPPQSIPNWWIWIYYLNPFHYGLEALMTNEFAGSKFTCSPTELLPPPYYPTFSLPFPLGFEGNSVCPTTVGEQELQFLDVHTSLKWRWINLLIMLAFSFFVVLLNLVAAAKVHNATKLKKPTKVRKTEAKAIQIAPVPITESSKGQGAHMSWENLSYSVKVKNGRQVEERVLLTGLTGYVRPGMLMALMGPSGAGKTTLLDVLGNRKTSGTIKGQILINGAPRDKFFGRYSAYVEQQDMLMPLATVYETVEFSARLRLPPELSPEEVKARIKETLNILDLDTIKGRFAGSLSMEQRKRLTIAVELVTNPQLLFLDEPTSGLDAQAATKVMQVILRVSQTGRSVICTIHQPSLAVFSYFDHLFLLKRGGKTIYFGPTGNDCEAVLAYFSSIGWECAPKRNPADFILDAAAVVSGETDDGEQQDPEVAYEQSYLKKEMESHTNEIPPGFVAQKFSRQYASSIFQQFACNMRREWANVRRRRQSLLARFARVAIMGVFIGTVFLQLSHDQESATDRLGMFFFILICIGALANDAVPNVVDSRAVFYREQASGTYRPLAYIVALISTDIPSTIASALLFSVITYWLAGLAATTSQFFFFTWIIFLFYGLCIAWVIFLSLVAPSGEIALAVSNASVVFFSIYSGFIISRTSMPKYWTWMYYLSFFHYPLEAALVNEMQNNQFSCPNGKGAVQVFIPSANTTKEFCPLVTGEQMLLSMDFEASAKMMDMGVTLGYWVAFAIGSYLALRFIRHIKR
eukprot:Phypoly_transcript_00652.p1 GENE.Phypoly_transcript_00652~~Phypoly_transcript_00652.p1  ORF type:complete len:1280 (+),score=171.37 Phypoly_transcript_00652:231-4070(+)